MVYVRVPSLNHLITWTVSIKCSSICVTLKLTSRQNYKNVESFSAYRFPTKNISDTKIPSKLDVLTQYDFYKS